MFKAIENLNNKQITCDCCMKDAIGVTLNDAEEYVDDGQNTVNYCLQKT